MIRIQIYVPGTQFHKFAKQLYTTRSTTRKHSLMLHCWFAVQCANTLEARCWAGMGNHAHRLFWRSGIYLGITSSTWCTFSYDSSCYEVVSDWNSTYYGRSKGPPYEKNGGQRSSYEKPNELRAGSSIKPQISSATKAACVSNSNVTYLVSCRPPWTVEHGDIAIFFCQGPRTGAGAENVSRPITDLQRSQ